MSVKSKPINILIILDGWGISKQKKGNAFALAKTFFLDSLINDFPSCELLCSGKAVGLPEKTIGNSEVGHMNIGAGRIVLQDMVRINKSIKDKSFFKNPALLNAMSKLGKDNSLHLIGLLSDGGVHSHINHLFALIDMAKQNQIKNLFIHPFLDGRDTPPRSSIHYIKQLQNYLDKKQYGKIASITGRFFAMDRDTRWERTKKAYDLLVNGKAKFDSNLLETIEKAYSRNETDEFIKPVSFCKDKAKINDKDSVIFFNFRSDRAKQITKALIEPNFNDFPREKRIKLSDFVCMTQYEKNFNLPIAFNPINYEKILGEVLSENKISQLRIAETEKYAHVTYFFNAGRKEAFDMEQRILIPSPRDIATYDLKPEMSALKLTDTAYKKIKTKEFDFIILNFANMDMVGHTGILDAAIKACETIDKCVEKLVKAVLKTNGTAIITADHGNAEQMIADDNTPHTAHTLNSVRFILADNKHKNTLLKNGVLGDIAPTILEILNIQQPLQMTGKSLIIK